MNTSSQPATTRIEAIDALRGFDMFWLTGGMAVVVSFFQAFYKPLPGWVAYHSSHVAWEGFSAWDLVMPLFIFVVGTAMPFSLARRREASSLSLTYLKIFKRVAILFLLGMAVQGNLLSFNPEQIKIYCNTLQAIASGYLIAAVCLLHLSIRQQIITTVVLLITYWALLKWVPFGNHAAGTLAPHANLPLYIDHAVFGKYQDGTNYAWLLPQLSFGALTLLGVMAGHILKGNARIKNMLILAITGTACLALGYLWSFDLPIIKHIFTGSMVLWAAGWCFILLALFYLLTDICGLSKLVFPFKVLGSNAIFVYLWTSMCPPQNNISKVLFQGFSSCFGNYADFVFYLLNYALIFTVMYYLYNKKNFIKI